MVQVFDALPRLKARGIQHYWRTMRSELSLTCSHTLDNALPNWITPNTRIGFLSLGLTDNANPGFYP